MKLAKKIQKSMFLIIVITLSLAYSSFIFIVYNQSIDIAKNQIEEQAIYVKNLLDKTNNLLNTIDTALFNTRITIIHSSGKVLYDTNKEISFENHLQRPEIQEALQKGTGQAIRTSDSLHQKLLYYAEQLPNGNFLRISRSYDSVWGITVKFLPLIFITGSIMFGFAFIFSRYKTTQIITPINKIDLSNPLETQNYEEIIPLLAKIEKQNLEQEALDRMRKEFSANVSHELKTPLTSISGYTELIKNGIAKQEDIQKFSTRIYDEAQRLIELIDNIILISKLDEEKISFAKENVNIFQLAVDVCNRFTEQANQKNIHIQLTGEKVHIQGIPSILDEMLQNLLENAIKYNKENGEVKIWIGKTFNKNKIIIEDTGIGIDKKYHERIFERFFRVDKSHNSKTGGSGLGLSIVKHAAQLHNMEINIESEEQKGTKISLTF